LDIPTSIASQPRSPLLEREDALEQLSVLARAAAGGRGAIVAIRGRPGEGKTTLLAAACGLSEEHGLRVFRARGSELEGDFAFGVVRQLLEPEIVALALEEETALFEGAAGLGRSVFGLQSDQLPESPFAVMHGLYCVLAGLAARGPLLLAVDDLHWSDRTTLELLAFMCGRIDDLPILVVLATRPPARDGTPPTPLAALLAAEGIAALSVGPLGPESAATLIEHAFEAPPDPVFTAACQRVTAGNPFAISELLGELRRAGAAPDPATAATLDASAPAEIERNVLARLGRLGSEALSVANALAVLSNGAPLRQVAALSDLDLDRAARAVDALVGAGILEEGSELCFVHPLLRIAVYESIGARRRARLHGAAAALLASEGAEPEAIAAHLLNCDPAGEPANVEHLRGAGSAALLRGAPSVAVTYLRRALAEPPPNDDRGRALAELGRAEWMTGDPLAIEHLQAALEHSSDPVQRAQLGRELAGALTLTGQWDAPIAIVETALAELGDRAPALAVSLERLRAGTAAYDPRLVAEFERRLPELRELVAREDPPARPLALVLAGVLAWRGHNVDEVVALVEHGWDGGGVLTAGVDEATLGQAPAALVIAEQLDCAGALVAGLLARAQETGSLLLYLLGTGYRGWIEARQGNLGAAEGEFRAALEQAREQHLNFAMPSLLWFAADVLLERPQAADLAAITESVELGSMTDTCSGAMLLDIRGRVRHAAGQTTAAIADLRRADEIYRALSLLNPSPSSWRSALALMLTADEHDEAHRLASEELEDARRIGQPRAIGIALRTLGNLEGGAAGRERLEQAVNVLEGSPARLEHGRALIELGAALRRSGQRAASRKPLFGGLDIAVAGGAVRLIERARVELAASGARPRRLRVSGRDSLTPSELRVPRHAAEGQSNREIAQALFVTTKTIEMHLSNVYRKLNIDSREKLRSVLNAE
jgi:DNA-binding CsgD family transcriptional regulator